MLFLVLAAVLWLTDPWHDVLALVLAVILYRPTTDLIRLTTATPAARKHYLGMVRARYRWRWLWRCTGLGQPELAPRNRPTAESRALVLVLLSITWRLPALAIGLEAAERTGRIH